MRINAAIQRSARFYRERNELVPVEVNWGGVSDALIANSSWSSRGGTVIGDAFVANDPLQPENVTTTAKVTLTREENRIYNTVTFDDGTTSIVRFEIYEHA